ncbi:hypothetical protein RFM26_01485 [Mesorhizobium sp. VK23B]|uniref:Uncharacterized protein n=1 Tax=Mesorhizobium dulcispinae TaxID=3072316 RepID=A0ABU4X7J1_9HYPH|nr:MULTISPECIES: hypothetical protein [unclassified Mesorhizobium]MDX8464357.1 hypothetical protein [Mesorhizobium sp. VK23B]MDX8470743.1 hypothetical protein [Mesorhizobium sp. VK23A]
MVELVVLEMAAARQRAKRAELSLKEAAALLDENCGLALCSRIRAGQACAKAARRRLLKMAPPISVQ